MKYRHNSYVNDPDTHGAGAITFNALKCSRCGDWYLSDGPEIEGRTSRMPWITAAVTHGLRQLKELPPDGCGCGKI
jgi:hypothetical protein